MPAAASSQQHSPTLCSFRPTFFLLLLPDEAALSEVAVCVAAGTPVHVRCQQSSKSKAPPTKITARVRAEQPGRGALPSLQEAVRDSDPAMTDQQSRVWRCRRNTHPSGLRTERAGDVTQTCNPKNLPSCPRTF